MKALVLSFCLVACATDAADKGDDPSLAADADAVVAAGGAADSSRRPTLVGSIASGETETADFGQDARYLAWTFTAIGGDMLRLSAEGAVDPDLDTVLFVYRARESGDPTGRALRYNDDHDGMLASLVEMSMPETGTFVALVRRYDYGSTGTVSLHLEGAGAICGVRGAAECGEGEYCRFERSASCGAADHPGVCSARPEACDAVFEPVCGCDGVTYANECDAASAGASVASAGECPSGGACGGLSASRCSAGEFCAFAVSRCGRGDEAGACSALPDVCPSAIDPVCGCDGRDYDNECEAARAGVSLDHYGACSDSPDCRTTGCGSGRSCSFCWAQYQCIPEGSAC
jgi:hypothetical protein